MALVHLFRELAQRTGVVGEGVGARAGAGADGVVDAQSVEVVEDGEELVGHSGPGQPCGEGVDHQKALIAGRQIGVGERDLEGFGHRPTRHPVGGQCLVELAVVAEAAGAANQRGGGGVWERLGGNAADVGVLPQPLHLLGGDRLRCEDAGNLAFGLRGEGFEVGAVLGTGNEVVLEVAGSRWGAQWYREPFDALTRRRVLQFDVVELSACLGDVVGETVEEFGLNDPCGDHCDVDGRHHAGEQRLAQVGEQVAVFLDDAQFVGG